MIGFCECGCGSETSVIRDNRPKLGLVKGEHRRFVNGHQRRKSPVDYVVDGNGCWIWQRSHSQNYGHLCVKGKVIPAHRFYYELKNGPIQKGLEMDHLCRVRLCVNPDHLEPVTHLENMRRRSCNKLNSEDVMKIRSSDLNSKELAVKFNVTQCHITDIIAGRRWSLPSLENKIEKEAQSGF